MNRRAQNIILWLSIGIILAIEGVLWLGDQGQLHIMSRRKVYEYAAFWAGLFYGWRPNFPGQPLSMFVTYPFVHSGFSHVVGNALGLAIFGPLVCEYFTTKRFLVLCLLTAVAGGIAFATLAPGPRPMVGASGVLYGLAGAWIVASADSRLRMAIWAAVVMAGNVITWWASSGQMAWQAHVGGFFAGAAYAFWLRPSLAKTRS